jgi:hypothetical protein
MGIFRTQFERKSILTHVTVEELENHTFGCMIDLAVDFDPAQLPETLPYYDIMVRQLEPGQWETTGEQQVPLEEDDVQSLGNAIEGDKTSELYNSEMY